VHTYPTGMIISGGTNQPQRLPPSNSKAAATLRLSELGHTGVDCWLCHHRYAILVIWIGACGHLMAPQTGHRRPPHTHSHRCQ
jgi:hypothetical protein